MKNAAIACILLALLNLNASATAPSVVTAPTVANNGCTENTGGFTLNIGTPNGTVSTGDVIIFYVLTDPGFPVTAITNGTGATGMSWTIVNWSAATSPTCSDSPSGGTVSIVYATVVSSGTLGVNVTINSASGHSFIGACSIDVQNIPQPTVVDQISCVDRTSSSTSLLSESITLSHPVEFVATMSAPVVTNATPCTGANGGFTFTGIDCQSGGDGVGGAPGGYLITSATGPYQAKLLFSGSTTAAVALVSFVGQNIVSGGILFLGHALVSGKTIIQ